MDSKVLLNDEEYRDMNNRLRCWSFLAKRSFPDVPYIQMNAKNIATICQPKFSRHSNQQPTFEELLRISDEDLKRYTNQEHFRDARVYGRCLFVQEGDTMEDLDDVLYITESGVGAKIDGKQHFFIQADKASKNEGAADPKPKLLQSRKRMRK